MAQPERSAGWTDRALLGAGIGSAILYVGTDVFVSLREESYVYWDQHISELMALGSPTRPLALPLFLGSSVLLAAFGFGVWRAAHGSGRQRIVAAMLLGAAVVGIVVPLFAPMSVRGTEQAGAWHLIGTGVNVLCFLLAAGFGAAAYSKPFRWYSIATIAVLLAAGAWAGMDAVAIGAGDITPWTGVKERINIYGIQLWVAVLSVMLLRQRVGRLSTPPAASQGVPVRAAVAGR